MLAAGSTHSLGGTRDGKVVATGNNRYGQCDMKGWADIVAIAADCTHTVGLKSDGSMVAVDDNRFGQCNVSQWGKIQIND